MAERGLELLVGSGLRKGCERLVRLIKSRQLQLVILLQSRDGGGGGKVTNSKRHGRNSQTRGSRESGAYLLGYAHFTNSVSLLSR